MRLRANVVKKTGATVHRHATVAKGIVAPGVRVPVAARVEIDESRSGGFFLFHYDAEGRCIADTWHPTLGDAKEQAKFEFGIEDADWSTVTN